MLHDAASTALRIGFLGLGAMGGPMVGNLLRAGHAVVAFDKLPERLAASAAEGAAAAASESEAVTGAEIVMTSLPSSQVFVRVAEQCLLPNARAGQVFVDLGTTEAPETRRLAAAFGRMNADLLDVPVSGGSHGSANGTLRMFIGGSPAAVERVRPVLELLGDPDRIVYCGPSGSGQVVKAVNQLAMGLADAAYLEAVAFGVRAGIDADAIVRAVGGAEGWRGHFGSIARRVAEGMGEDVLVKYPELRYFLREAREGGRQTPLTRALYDFLKVAEHTWQDNMGRPRPCLWHELMNRPASPDVGPSRSSGGTGT